MDILDFIKTRRSTRKYKADPVPKELIEKVVTAGIWAPSSMNRQPWRFVVVTKKEARQQLSDEAKRLLHEFCRTKEARERYGADAVGRFDARALREGDTIFYGAPVLIFIILAKHYDDAVFDCGLAAENMMIAAHGLNFATCPIGLAGPLNRSPEARQLLGLKERERIVIGMCLGYPDESPEGKGRDLEVIRWIE